ncbi:hypothetical protein GWO43_05260 [candidate division KSB1 bacterium]|nr:hypothetical protein [candidate division KSB1 bacterium]NIR71493.1 hypothetical protein [candidate division KSB1 bacterium]NIS23414.1 hypothetical protein [candidate division KSB1 bacterium]NIT70305.1 hypothetical protein [candidate division KSB1 bacterium]NIU24028.1 hypothetical protein [candidate division KSB1 bacterium]
MATANVIVEPVPGIEKAVRIPLGNITDAKTALDILQDTFESCFEKGQTRIVLDLKNIQFPSSSLIALLIEATTRARRLGGDLKIINLSHSAKNNLATFSPLNYLSFEEDESLALQDFRELISEDNNDNKKEDNNKNNDLHTIQSEEIAEDPILERLGNSVEEPVVKEDKRKHLRVKSLTKNLYKICDFVTDYADQVGFKSKDIGKIKIAVYEACLNVIEHAYHSNPDNWIDIWVEYDKPKFQVEIQDYGNGFDEISLKDYNVRSAVDHRQTGGFGLYIIRRSMDEIDYEADAVNGNRLTLIKFLK